MRSDTDTTDRHVRRLLADHLVEGVEAPANFSIRLDAGPASVAGPSGTRATGKATPTHVLFRSWVPTARSRSASRVLRALLGLLDGYGPDDGSLLRVSAKAAVSADGWAVLMPPDPDMSPDQYERRLAGSGLRFLDGPEARLDRASGELVVSDPQLAFDRSVLDELDAGAGAPGPEPVAVGTYPVRAWIVAAPAEGPGDLPRAAAMTAAIPRVTNRAVVGAQATLDALAGALRPARCLPWPVEGAAASVTLLRRLLAG